MARIGAGGKSFYSRHRVSKLLYGMLSAPLTLVMAQSGYEKTESVMAFLGRRKDITVMRMNFFGGLPSESALWDRFCKAVAQANAQLAQELLDGGFAKTVEQRCQVASRMRDQLDGLNVLVLEAYEECGSVEFERLLMSLAQVRLTNLYIVVLSRTRPDFMADGFFGGDCCSVIDQEDLAYTADEVRHYFESSGYTLSENELARVTELAGGWPAAVRMLREEYEQSGLIRQTEKCVELMRTVCLEKLSLPEQKLLACLSVLERFTLEQVAYVTENRKTRYQMVSLYEDNCFLTREEEGGWYRLHPFMKAAAREKLEVLVSDLQQFYFRCARWYDVRGEKLSALRFYSYTRNETWLCELFAQPGAAEIVDQDPIAVQETLPKFSARARQKYIGAALADCYALLVYYDREEGMRQLSALQTVYASESLRKGNRNQVLGELMLLESLANPGDLDKTEALYKVASRNFGGGYSSFFSQKSGALFGSPSILWRYHMRAGSLAETTERIGRLYCGTTAFPGGTMLSVSWLAQAEYAYNTGDFSKAREQAYHALIQGKAKEQDGVVTAALFVLARAAVVCGDVDSASAYLGELRQMAAKGTGGMRPGTGAAISYLSACFGSMEPMNTECMVPSFNSFIMKLVEGKRLLQQKVGIQLELFAENMLYEPRAGVFAKIYGGIYLAAAKERLGEISEADRVLERTVELAAADGILMPFVENAPYLLPVLVRCNNPFAVVLREKAEEFQRNYYRFLVESGEHSLSKTELQIIRWYAGGCKQTEVARNLNLSVTATRRAINDIYRKIGIADITRIAEMVLR